ncbi:protein ENL [Plutella xylostella]|uniref:protein ENL n=1 Tax=Plutella xylostella TaxID=51655 RepID=UPI0005D0A7B3|nr:protein ENL [Plutella xylostella]
MTEGSRLHHDKPMCVRIWLEVGHSCSPRPRSPQARPLSLDWRVWVRGVGGHDISAFVHKVVFHLHPSTAFVYPKRVIQEPPYEIQESGCASIDIPIHVYLKHSSKPKKIKLRYSLHIEDISASSSEVSCVFYDVERPSEALRRALLAGGGEAAPGPRALVVITNEAKPHRHHSKVKKYKFIDSKKPSKKPQDCPKCGDTNVDFRKLLRKVSMTESEVDLVSQLYAACSGYEQSAGALVLPPWSDPIYRMPELPPSLRPAASENNDYTVQ